MACGCQHPPSERPNIIVILVDDMGYSDPGCFGGEVQTPNLDRLAENGIRLTQFYNTARCCPTRASLLTGLYPHQAGIGQMTGDRGLRGYQGRLTRESVTIAEVLKDAGYSTGMVGKWHVSLTRSVPGGNNAGPHLSWLNHQDYADRPFSDLESYPLNRGFDKYFGNIWGVVNFFDPFSLVNGLENVTQVPEYYYYTDAISDTAVAYIDQFAAEEEPFFLYIAHTAPHWPLHAPEEDILKYRDTYTAGWDKIRTQRVQRMKELGIVEEDVMLSPANREGSQADWENNPHRDYETRKMAVHAAMIDRVDQGLGRIIQKLKEAGEYENTVIMFLSDNGASPEMPGQPGFDRNGETRDGRKVIYTRHDKTVMPGPETTYAGIGRSWANVANTPFRFWKARCYEGGICTPFVVHWPEGITARSGSINRSPGHVMDIMATCLDLGRAEYPDTFKGEQILPLEGKSLVPLFFEGQREGYQFLFFEHYDSRALRMGKWKLVALPDGEWELYNLAEDRTEMSELSAQFPEKLEEMIKIWQQEADRTYVYPAPPKRR